jgi:acetyl-CoA carboxylase biotin carboxyl carrier protein
LDFNEIQELTDLVKRSDIHELEVERVDTRLRIVNKVEDCHLRKFSGKSITDDETIAESPQQISDIDDDIGSCEFFIVKSPIIGVFFSAPSPDSHDFVSKDDVIRPDSVVCIIEAMKVMNEIQAEVDGTVEDILVQNGQAVEFGQPLFKIRLK